MAHKSKQEITAIIASVLLAFVMWIYAMTDKNPMEHKTVENIPVQLINTEALEQYSLALTPEQNFIVNLEIRCKALDVGVAVDPANYSIVADLNSADFLKKGENNIRVEIIEKPNGIQVENPTGVPIDIKVKLEKLETKSVGVNINLIGSVKEGFGYLNPITKPTQVVVSGPESIVNSVNSITGQIDINDKSNDVNESIVIKPVDKEGKEIKYVSLASQTVDVSVPVKPAKEVSVVVKTIGNIGENKILKKINQSTDKVIIVGDRKYLDKVKEIETVPYDISKVTATHTDTLSLNLPEGIEIFHGMSTLNVEFVVENIIEKTVKIPINIVNSREGYSYSTSVPDVNITLQGAESIINSLDTSSISAIVDVNSIDVGQHSLELKINIPNGLSIVKTIPDKVSVTITKPETETTSP
jgi:YbbR domain-containing protein